MDAAKVLLIESVRANGKSFAPALKKRYDVAVAYSGKQGVSDAHGYQPAVVVLDAVSMRTSGDRICQSLRDCMPDTPIIHIRPVEQARPATGSADIYLYHPFTWRKLVNKIKHFVAVQDREGDVLEVGALRLDVPRRMLVIGEQEKRLTPKLVGLAEVFLRHPDSVIDRKTLIQKVWNTEYMGDTRTLDVHIRWLREAVEENPSRPKVITTVRGVGYRLIPPA